MYQLKTDVRMQQAPWSDVKRFSKEIKRDTPPQNRRLALVLAPGRFTLSAPPLTADKPQRGHEMLYQIRANYNADSIVMYQAFNPRIADTALQAQRLVSPFSTKRMTWIKPSFLWLMHRSNWARKKNQERILGVRIAREGWEQALRLGVLTHSEMSVHGSHQAWRKAFQDARVHIQWDTERSLRGAALPHYSIQVGVGRHTIDAYVHDWTVSITDETERALKIASALQSGKAKAAKRHLPPEKLYPVPDALKKHLRISV